MSREELRRKINANPRAAVEAYRRLKSEDFLGFGVTVTELAAAMGKAASPYQVRPAVYSRSRFGH